MNWTSRMTRHGSERSLNSSAMNPGHGSRAPATSPTSVGSPRPFPGTPILSINSNGNQSTPTKTTTTATMIGLVSPAGDSRIPRPSPTSLRRSASMRVRGERVGSHLRHSSASTTLHQHHQQRHGHLLQQQQQQQQQHQHYHHHQQIAEEFPVITENGIDTHRNRSFSLSLTPARPRPGHAASGTSFTGSMHQVDDSDAESVKSFGSACSTASACDHAHFALNGTTWSGRSRKYVVHCSNHNGDSEQYLTPTQRAARQVRKFQNLLNEARKEIEEKDREIFRLTKEVVELRLYKASLNSPDDRTDSSDALTVRENNPFSPESPCKDLPEEIGFETTTVPTSPETPEKRVTGELSASLADSGHFDDESVNSKDSGGAASDKVDTDGVVNEVSTARTLEVVADESTSSYTRPNVEINDESTVEDRSRLVEHYESRIEEMHRRHVDEIQELKQKHNDKVESLLNQLSEVSTRYCEVRPSMDAAEAKARELETELESVKAQLAEQKSIFDEQEERNKQMYLKMYAKGQEAARIEQADKIYEQASQTPPKVTMAEVLQQLNVTQAELENVKGTSYLPELHISADRSQCLLSAQEAVSLWVLATRKAMYRRIVECRNRQGALDPEITLQFLKSAIYYFLTDKENHHGHLNAIESILGFTDNEKLNIDKIYRSTRK